MRNLMWSAQFANFDPAFASSFNTERAISPTASQLQGAPTLSDLEQQTTFGYTQTLQTGTNFNIGLSADKSSTNSIYLFSQPLDFRLPGFHRYPAPATGKRALCKPCPHPHCPPQHGANHQPSSRGRSAIRFINWCSAYWSVVQARENMKIAQKSQDAAQASYDHDKRALELGALPPLDIYRSEAAVANRKVAAIQAQYQLKSAEDQFRYALGADQDTDVRGTGFGSGGESRTFR